MCCNILGALFSIGRWNLLQILQRWHLQINTLQNSLNHDIMISTVTCLSSQLGSKLMSKVVLHQKLSPLRTTNLYLLVSVLSWLQFDSRIIYVQKGSMGMYSIHAVDSVFVHSCVHHFSGYVMLETVPDLIIYFPFSCFPLLAIRRSKPRRRTETVCQTIWPPNLRLQSWRRRIISFWFCKMVLKAVFESCRCCSWYSSSCHFNSRERNGIMLRGKWKQHAWESKSLFFLIIQSSL